MPNSSELWGTWVDQCIQASEKTLLAAIGDVMADERVANRTEHEELRRGERNAAPGTAGVKDRSGRIARRTQGSQSDLDGVESRLAKLEVPLSRLRAAG